MAVTATNSRAQLVIRDSGRKTVATFGGVRPDAAPADLLDFTNAVGVLSKSDMSHTYLVVSSELQNA